MCEASARALAAAKRKVANLAKTADVPRSESSTEAPKRKRASTTGSRSRKKAPVVPVLAAAEIEAMRVRAGTYDRTHAYSVGDWLIHPKFGVGRVEMVYPEKKIDLLFEGGGQKTLIHDRQ